MTQKPQSSGDVVPMLPSCFELKKQGRPHGFKGFLNRRMNNGAPSGDAAEGNRSLIPLDTIAIQTSQ